MLDLYRMWTNVKTASQKAEAQASCTCFVNLGRHRGWVILLAEAEVPLCLAWHKGLRRWHRMLSNLERDTQPCWEGHDSGCSDCST